MSRVKVDGCAIHYERAGSGPPLVLLHGIGSNAGSWEPVMARLAGRFSVIAWDAPGYGESDDPSGPFTLTGYALALRGLLDGLGVGEAALVGHSFGALIAMEFCRRFPAQVRALVLADAALGGGALDDPVAAEAKCRARLADFLTLSRDAFARKRAPKLLSPSAPPELVEKAVERMAMVHDVGYRVAAEVLHRSDARECLPYIRCPVLIVWGGMDVITPVEGCRWLQQRIPGSRATVLPEAGHLCYLECPERFAQAVEEFLLSVEQEGCPGHERDGR